MIWAGEIQSADDETETLALGLLAAVPVAGIARPTAATATSKAKRPRLNMTILPLRMVRVATRTNTCFGQYSPDGSALKRRRGRMPGSNMLGGSGPAAKT